MLHSATESSGWGLGPGHLIVFRVKAGSSLTEFCDVVRTVLSAFSRIHALIARGPQNAQFSYIQSRLVLKRPEHS